MRKVTLLVVLAFVGGAGIAGVAGAGTSPRQAATDQYGTNPVVGEGTTTTTPATVPTPTTTGGTTPTSGGDVEDEGSSGASPNGDEGSGGQSDGATGTGGSTESARAAARAAALATRVAVLDFGLSSRKVRRDINDGIKLAGLRRNFLGRTSTKRIERFLTSASAKALSDDGPEAVGRAVGAQLVNPTPALRRAFPKIFGPNTRFLPVLRAVLDRRAALSADLSSFMTGVAEGLRSTGIPLAYAERSDAKKKFAEDFKELSVLTVDDIDKPTGKLRLAKILLGQITAQKQVDAVELDTAASVTTDADGSSGGALPWILGSAVLTGLGAMAIQSARRRRLFA